MGVRVAARWPLGAKVTQPIGMHLDTASLIPLSTPHLCQDLEDSVQGLSSIALRNKSNPVVRSHCLQAIPKSLGMNPKSLAMRELKYFVATLITYKNAATGPNALILPLSFKAFYIVTNKDRRSQGFSCFSGWVMVVGWG